MRALNSYAAVILLTLGCRSAHATRNSEWPSSATSDTINLQMRAPRDPFRMGPTRPEWTGTATLTAMKLEFEFPGIEADNVGCAAVDSVPRFRSRQYYWLATAQYPNSNYPNNHFQQVAVRFTLGSEVLPTRPRLDSALAAQRVVVREAAGEPPMDVRRVVSNDARAVLTQKVLAGETLFHVRLIVEDPAAVKAFLSPTADSVSLSWCQRDQWLTHLTVALERK